MLQRDTKILVTGAGGVLGQALVPLLSNAGFTQVFAPSRGELNLLIRENVNKYLGREKPECIIHLASIVYGLLGNMRNQFRSLVENTQINDNLFRAIIDHPVSHIFFSGTVASYPYPYESLPLKEENFFNGLPHDGEFGYASAKRHAFNYLKLLRDHAGVRFTYGVFTNLYGEMDRFDIENGHVVPSLIAKANVAAKDQVELSVWGDGTAERDFMHAEDAARAIAFCLDNDVDGLVNIATGEAVSIKDVALSIAEFAGVDRVSFQSDMPIGIPRRTVDDSRLRDMGFRPRISLKEGLRRTSAWYALNKDGARK